MQQRRVQPPVHSRALHYHRYPAKDLGMFPPYSLAPHRLDGPAHVPAPTMYVYIPASPELNARDIFTFAVHPSHQSMCLETSFSYHRQSIGVRSPCVSLLSIMPSVLAVSRDLSTYSADTELAGYLGVGNRPSVYFPLSNANNATPSTKTETVMKTPATSVSPPSFPIISRRRRVKSPPSALMSTS
jgi:hypothetical protein